MFNFKSKGSVCCNSYSYHKHMAEKSKFENQGNNLRLNVYRNNMQIYEKLWV